MALLIREYLEYYRMEYSLSVYVPEVALSHVEYPPKDDLCNKANIKPPSTQESSVPLLVHMVR